MSMDKDYFKTEVIYFGSTDKKNSILYECKKVRSDADNHYQKYL
jgi:hypothetical protein